MSIHLETNSLIHQLILVSDINNKEVSSRLKLSNIINEYGKQLNQNFATFVNFSTNRYHNSKKGKQIESAMTDQKPNINSLSRKILFNSLYNSQDLDKEKSKLSKGKTNPNYKSKVIKEIQNQIKSSISNKHYIMPYVNKKEGTNGDNDNSDDDKKRRKLNLSPAKKSNTDSLGLQGQSKARIHRKSLTSVNILLVSAEKLRAKYDAQYYISTTNEQKRKDTIRDYEKKPKLNYKEVIENHTKLLLDIVDTDQQVIKDKLSNYKRNLSNFVLTNNGGLRSHRNKKEERTPTNTEVKLCLADKLRLLNYNDVSKKGQKSAKHLLQRGFDQNIDINRVLKYTKRGQDAKAQSNAQSKSIARTNTNTESKEKSGLNILTPSSSSSRLFNGIYSKSNTITRFNTIAVLKQQAENCLNINEHFEEKKTRLDQILHETPYELPKLTSTDNLMAIPYTSRSNAKAIAIDNSSPMNKKWQSLSLSPLPMQKSNDRINDLKRNLYSKPNRKMTNRRKATVIATPKAKKSNEKMKAIEDIYDKFLNVYEAKKVDWAKEDTIKRKEIEEEEERMNNVYTFITALGKTKRTASLYIDPYSSHGNVNAQIKEFSKTIGNACCSKRKLNDNINAFITKKDRLHKERQIEVQREEDERTERTNKEKEKMQQWLSEYQVKLNKDNILDIKANEKREGCKNALLLNDMNGRNDIKDKEKRKEEDYADWIQFRDYVAKKEQAIGVGNETNGKTGKDKH